MAPIFYAGLHQPSDAQFFEHVCISINRLRTRCKPLGCPDVLIDSGAFTELQRHGAYRHDVDDYAQQIHRLHSEGVATISAVVSQDFMCEPFMLAKTGLTVRDHQRMTIERYDALLAALRRRFDGEPPFAVLPVVQGFDPQEYVDHVAAYGERLRPGMWVGIGSVCKRQGDPEKIIEVLSAVRAARPGLRMHGFGVKYSSLKHAGVREMLYSADSLAWSHHARANGRNSNDRREARAFVAKVATTSDAEFVPWQMPLPFWRL